MTWGFIWLMFVLKIPIVGLLYLVWWAVRQTDEPETAPGEDGGLRRPHEPQGPRRWPRHRGPHGEPVVPSPPRVRGTVARARADEHAHG